MRAANARLDVLFGDVGRQSAKSGASARLNSAKSSLIEMVSKRMPRFAASWRLSSMEPEEEYGLGMPMHVTFSAPSASAAMAATSAESMPPLSATTTLLNPHLRT